MILIFIIMLNAFEGFEGFDIRSGFYALLCVNIVLMYGFYTLFFSNKSLKQLLNSLETTDTIKPLDGVFEIHITIDPENNFVKLLQFAKKMSKTTNLKIVFAVSEVKNNQLMIGHFTRKNTEKEAIQTAKQFEADMIAFGIKVLRVKIESHNTGTVPLTKKDYVKFYDYLKTKYEGQCGKPYFEFHVKIGNNTINENYMQALENDIKYFKSVAISYNLCSSNCKPLLTVRVYDEGYQMAQKYKDEVLDSLKLKGYVFEDKIQTEFSIYDSNSNLDNGWLN